MPRAKATDWVICDTCTHTENVHEKYDGRAPKRERPCKGYKCDCTHFIERIYK